MTELLPLAGRRIVLFAAPLYENIEGAGATWGDETCVVDGPITTSCYPHDLGPFCRAIKPMLREIAAV